MEQFIFSGDDVTTEPDGRKLVAVEGSENFHLLRVLRLRIGDTLLATDGQGRTFLCVLKEASRERSVCEAVQEYHDLNISVRDYCIGLSILKPVSKVELAIEKCTELGARRFLLFYSERSEKTKLRMDRLQAVVKSAVKQSLQSRIPEIRVAKNIDEVSAHAAGYEQRFVLHEKSSEKFEVHLSGLNAPRTTMALIGPEGGFADSEIELLTDNGFMSCSLGSPRLRSETAAIKAASLLSVY